MNLEEAIQQLINVGEKDPLEIARKIGKKYDSKWLAAELTAHAEDIISGIARQRLGAMRRSAELALQPGNDNSQNQLRVAKAWIPGVGWKSASDLTADDLRARAEWYDGLVRASARRAEWCREVAGLMEAEGVETLGKLKAQLPALADGIDLQLEAA